MHIDAEGRKARSLENLKQYNIPYIDHLPVIETPDEVKIRTKDDIAKRAIACLITIQVACDRSEEDSDIEESIGFMKDMLKQYGVEDCLTAKEQEFFNGSPSEQSVTDMIWRYEAYWVLLWALGITEDLSYPSDICDCDFAIKVVSDCDSYEEFMEKVHLRDIDEILNETDLIFRYDWACVNASLKGLEAPGGLISDIVIERHKACNWLIDFDQDDDWDNVSTNT